MQEVFENIIEKLEVERGRYFLTIANTGEKCLDIAYEKVGLSIDNAIEIVKQIAEEYNNGWIPCNEQLPELETEVLIYTEQGGMTIASLTKPDIFWEDEEENILIGVIAWQPLPEPYRPCTNTDCVYNSGNECPASEGCAGYEQKGE